MPDARPFLAIAAAAVLLAACGGGAPLTSASSAVPATPAAPSPAAPSPTDSGSAADGSGVTRCHTDQLRLAPVGPPSAGAGNIYQELGLTNRSAVACQLYGYVGMALLDAGGKQLPTRVVRDTGSRFPWAHPGLLTLQPAATSPFWVHWEDVPTGAETSCPPAAGLILTPPDETTQLRLDGLGITACSGGELDVSPVTPPGTKGP